MTGKPMEPVYYIKRSSKKIKEGKKLVKNYFFKIMIPKTNIKKIIMMY
tara:strand:- start:39 stop:182 length:144 start_codon:yes stop_codon:yes gene_type:complete